MATCTIWNGLSLGQKKAMVNCIKHPFAKDNHKSVDCKRGIGICKHCSELNEHHYLLCPEKALKKGKTIMGRLSVDPRGTLRTSVSEPKKVGQLRILGITILLSAGLVSKSRRK